jgi:hypothetical protein
MSIEFHKFTQMSTTLNSIEIYSLGLASRSLACCMLSSRAIRCQKYWALSRIQNSQFMSYSLSPGIDAICELIFEMSTMSGLISLIVWAPSNRMFISNSSCQKSQNNASWQREDFQGTCKICNALSTPSCPYDESAYRNGRPIPTIR